MGVGAFAALAGDDVPLFGGAHNDLGVGDLFLGQLMVPRKLLHSDPVRLQPLSKSIPKCQGYYTIKGGNPRKSKLHKKSIKHPQYLYINLTSRSKRTRKTEHCIKLILFYILSRVITLRDSLFSPSNL